MPHERLANLREAVRRKTKSRRATARAKARKKRKSRERVEEREPETTTEEARVTAREARDLASDVSELASEFSKPAKPASEAGGRVADKAADTVVTTAEASSRVIDAIAESGGGDGQMEFLDTDGDGDFDALTGFEVDLGGPQGGKQARGGSRQRSPQPVDPAEPVMEPLGGSDDGSGMDDLGAEEDFLR